jgi:hypothetical protein
MHIAIIGATALIVFLMMGGLMLTAVVMEQRTRRQNAAAAAAGTGAVTDGPLPAADESEEKPKAEAATAGR